MNCYITKILGMRDCIDVDMRLDGKEGLPLMIWVLGCYDGSPQGAFVFFGLGQQLRVPLVQQRFQQDRGKERWGVEETKDEGEIGCRIDVRRTVAWSSCGPRYQRESANSQPIVLQSSVNCLSNCQDKVCIGLPGWATYSSLMGT